MEPSQTKWGRSWSKKVRRSGKSGPSADRNFARDPLGSFSFQFDLFYLCFDLISIQISTIFFSNFLVFQVQKINSKYVQLIN